MKETQTSGTATRSPPEPAKPSSGRRALGALPCSLALVMWSCGSPQSSIQFTKVPPAEAGDPIQLEQIEGRVQGAKAGQKVILYAKSGRWWIQPLADNPFTAIQPDSSWRNVTHPGTEYAALLVDSGYIPSNKMQELPLRGGRIRDVATRRGSGSVAPAASRIIQFSSYDWEVRHQPSERGGTMNPYDPNNVWIDPAGYLHLRTSRRGDGWAGAEVQLTHSLGHGLYRFIVHDISTLDPATTLTLYTRDETATQQNNREIDIEVSRWGDPAEKNAQYVVPPFNEPANVTRFDAPPGRLTWSFRWLPGSVSFLTTRGARVIAQREFTFSVPSPGSESARINLYVYGSSQFPARSASEVVVERFEYLP